MSDYDPWFHAKMMIGAALVWTASALVTASAAPLPTSHQNLHVLTTAARKWLAGALAPTNGNRTIAIQRPDPRLVLPECHHLKFKLTQGTTPAGRLPLLVRCRSPRWQMYLIANVQVLVPVLVSTRALPAGVKLDPSDYVLASRPLQNLPPGALTSPDDVAGHVLARGISTGIPLTASMVVLPQSIRQGNRVTIVAAGVNLRLSVAGIAMQAGRIGQFILVRNASSGKVIRAMVTGPGRVRVTF